MKNFNAINQQILKYLKEGNSITVQQAMRFFGTTELRKIVSRFRRKGYVIKGTPTFKESNGRQVMFYTYSLVQDQNFLPI